MLFNVCTGTAAIISLSLNQQESAIVCVSRGGPATSVVWKHDNITKVNNLDYHQIQTVVNAETATYENKLISSNTTYLVGAFTCTVINSRGSSESLLTLNGMKYIINFSYYCEHLDNVYSVFILRIIGGDL